MIRWNKIKVLVKKELLFVLGNKRVLIPMCITPLTLLVLTPLVLIYGMNNGQIPISIFPDNLSKNLPESIMATIGHYSTINQYIYLFCNYIMSGLFILMPLMICSWISGTSMVTEKENKTMETLLYAPLTKLEFFIGKILGSFIPSILVSYLGICLYSVLIYFITYNSFNSFILNSSWLYLIFLLLPASLIFGVTANILASIKAKSVQEAQQFSIIVTFPIMMLFIYQMLGSLYFNSHFIIILAIVFFIIDIILLYIISKLFSNEKIIKM